MWRNGLLLAFVSVTSFALHAQLNNSYTVLDNQNFDKVKFCLRTTNGHCFIEPGNDSDLMNIYSETKGNIEPSYNESIKDRTKQVQVNLDKANSSSIGATFSSRMFGYQTVDDYTWKVYLSKQKPLKLYLNYAVGDTYINLSDLPVEKLKINTGSANVNINYDKGFGNKLEMDTFFVKVDMGSLIAKNLYLCNSKNIIADVGFGKVQMDFGGAKIMRTEVVAMVGAGKLVIILPAENIPVKINIHDSPLCHVKMPRRFKNSTSNEFVTLNFDENQNNYINFNVDVAVGNIIFKNSTLR